MARDAVRAACASKLEGGTGAGSRDCESDEDGERGCELHGGEVRRIKSEWVENEVFARPLYSERTGR